MGVCVLVLPMVSVGKVLFLGGGGGGGVFFF